MFPQIAPFVIDNHSTYVVLVYATVCYCLLFGFWTPFLSQAISKFNLINLRCQAWYKDRLQSWLIKEKLCHLHLCIQLWSKTVRPHQESHITFQRVGCKMSWVKANSPEIADKKEEVRYCPCLFRPRRVFSLQLASPEITDGAPMSTVLTYWSWRALDHV